MHILDACYKWRNKILIIYFIGMLLSALLGYIYSISRKSNKHSFNLKISNSIIIKFKFNIWAILAMIPLTLIAGFRYGVGQDYFYTYVPIFQEVLNGDSDEAWGDSGYILLNKFVQLFTNDYSGIFLLTSIIFCVLIFLSIYENSLDIQLSIILLVCTGYYFCFLNGIRQMLTVAIFMYAIKYILKNDFKRYFLLIILASFIHLSALIYIPVYFIRNVKLNKYKMLIAIIATFASAKIAKGLILKLILLTKYSWYINSVYDTQKQGYVIILLNLIIFIFAIIYYKYNDMKNNLFINLQFLAVLVSAFIGEIPSANRILWNFAIASIILIPNTITKEHNRSARIFIKTAVVILYLVYFYYTVGINNSNNVLPYRTIFDR